MIFMHKETGELFLLLAEIQSQVSSTPFEQPKMRVEFIFQNKLGDELHFLKDEIEHSLDFIGFI